MSHLRSDHLKAVLIYALEQAKTSGIEVLDFGDNENALGYEEQVEAMESMLATIEKLTKNGNRDIEVS